MVTQTQATTARDFHYGTCTETVGPRGGITRKVEAWRANGAIKTWKTRKGGWRLPIKYGMRRYGYMDQNNAGDFHVASECPLEKTEGETAWLWLSGYRAGRMADES